MTKMKSEGSTRVDQITLEDLRSEVTVKRKRSRVRQRAKNFAQSVSLIGLTHATDDNTCVPRRCVWIFFVLIGVGLAAYQIQDRLVYYFSYPFNTELHLENPKELRFPQVTICKETWASKSRFKELGLEQSFLDLFETIFEGEDDNDEWIARLHKTVSDIDDLTAEWNILSKNLSHPWQDLLNKILWDGRVQKAEDLITEILTDSGYCFAVGTDDKPLIVDGAGLRSGLALYLDAKQADSVFRLNYGNDAFTGFRILLHDPKEVPRMLEAGIAISPGTITQVTVDFVNITHLGPPFYECNTDADYRAQNCLANCEDNFYMEKCNCTPFYLDRSDGVTPEKKFCSLVEYYFCRNQFELVKRKAEQECACKQQCSSLLYRNSISLSNIPADLLSSYESSGFVKNASSKEHSSSVPDLTIVYIYFPSLMYTNVITVEAYSFLALLCDVGGALSLLLGATLLTIYEVAEFLALVTTDFVRSRVRGCFRIH